MTILNVENLSKKYDNFHLDNLSFSLDEGYIMGFIGSNGAGKTTTLKGILGMIQTESGKVEVFGQDFKDNEIAIKQDIAFMMGSSDYYSRRQIKTITRVVKRFYPNWNQNTYEMYLKKFGLDPEKKIMELSQGMRVKYSIALALSHEARLIILDEPTSGLDPVARDGLLEIFQELVEDGKKSILFSTHITSDLEKCADFITYIINGKLLVSTSKDDFLDSFRLVNGSKDMLDEIKKNLISYKLNSFGFLGLIKTEDLDLYPGINSEAPNLDDIMIFQEKKEENHAESAV